MEEKGGHDALFSSCRDLLLSPEALQNYFFGSRFEGLRGKGGKKKQEKGGTGRERMEAKQGRGLGWLWGRRRRWAGWGGEGLLPSWRSNTQLQSSPFTAGDTHTHCHGCDHRSRRVSDPGQMVTVFFMTFFLSCPHEASVFPTHTHEAAATSQDGALSLSLSV